MHARKLLQFINVVIAIGLAAAAIAVYWYAWRPLPQVSGTILAPVQKPVRIERDALGVPHIQAETQDDLFFAQGFATAQDRLWQMETFRRLAAGELSEIVGAAGLESDREFRKLRLTHIAEKRARSLAAEDRAIIAAYARGVNHFIDTQRNRLPLEYTLLNAKPRLWRIEDTLLIGLMMEQTLSNSYRIDLAVEAMYRKGNPKLVEQLWPARTGSEQQPGSNAWAVRGEWTSSGKAMIANDMHLGWSLPGVWYMVHLHGGGFRVAGVSVPGAPLVVVGRNERIAWGITNLGFDVQDLYWESPTATGTLQREVIAVRGAKGEVFQQALTDRGPVFAGPDNRPVSLRWISAERPFRLGLTGMNKARNWEEFRNATRDFPGASSNITYADVDGNIGLQVTGPLPIRKGCNSKRINTPETCEWQGFIPFEELPSFYNPGEGQLVTGNQNPFPQNYKHEVEGNFAPQYRSNQIKDRLLSQRKWTTDAMLQLQADVYSGFSHFLARQVVAAWDKKKASNPALLPAIDLLRNWDGQMRADQAAPLIVTYTAQHLKLSVAGKASGLPDPSWDPYIYFGVLENLLRERSTEWFADWDHELLRCLQEAVDEG